MDLHVLIFQNDHFAIFAILFVGKGNIYSTRSLMHERLLMDMLDDMILNSTDLSGLEVHTITGYN